MNGVSLRSELSPGLAVIHANRLENLRDLVVAWIDQHPLPPLRQETILVQSNGMAQWLKLALAAGDGLNICAAVDVQLPARFLWRCYQTVLGEASVPTVSPFDKAELSWRIFRRLPELLGDSRFQALRRFLADDGEATKRHQLAECLADLFDQYQVYRADWLEDWAAGRDQLRGAHGQFLPLAEDQSWQPVLWRAIVADVAEAERGGSRAELHRRFMNRLDQLQRLPDAMPSRVIVFGISSLPEQTLDAFRALGRFCQILLCVNNPCRYYWADIIEHKELLRSQRRRHPDKLPPSFGDEELHLHANPLLAAWGKQARDYIGLLSAVDEPEQYQQWFQRIDLFEDCISEETPATLLQRVQQAVLDLQPLPATAELRPKIESDLSLVFHMAHSPQREVEILHDQLLALMNDPDRPLHSRDVIVMVPDIDRYAPHIRAVFGQIDGDDPRYIPFSVSDQRERGRNPLLIALEQLLHLPLARFGVGDLLDWLDVPAVRRRFAIDEAHLPTLGQWIREAGIRWGLHAEHRQILGMPAGLEQNTWHFGFRRMLLGYAVGADHAWDNIQPYDEIGGLDAALLGPLIELLDALELSWRELATTAEPAEWSRRFRALLARFFLADGERETMTLDALYAGLDDWDDVCARVGLREALPLNVAREAWLAGIDQPSLTQRFLVGRVNFCTLMPMRSIPFQLVCLLGMNDGDFPRAATALSFDLMASAKSYRPGDRSRRDDDRYLFLEALLSARRTLYISWIGRGIQDNALRPPSLLVGQLRDYLAAGWQLADHGDVSVDGGQALLDRITVKHPLQPFSRRYFLKPDDADFDGRLFSYAAEWRAALLNHPNRNGTDELPPLTLATPLSLDLLATFLRHPVKAFFNQRLQVWFEVGDVGHEDCESFAFDRLQAFRLGQELLQAAWHDQHGQAERAFAEQRASQQRQGLLPMAGFANAAQADYAEPAWLAWQGCEPRLREFSEIVSTPLAVQLEFALGDGVEIVVEDWLSGLRRNRQGQWLQILATPQTVFDKRQRPKRHNLLRGWIKHLAACAMSVELTTLYVGADGEIRLPPLAGDEAYRCLQTITAAWWHGMRMPLPLACRSAFAWLDAEDGQNADAAAKLYYGDGYATSGEIEDAYLARQYPDFQMLVDEGFERWVGQLYQPLWLLTQGNEG